MRSARTPPSTFLLLPIRLSNSGGNLSVAAASTSQGLGCWSALTRAHTLTEAETFSSRSCDKGAVLPGDEKATRVRCSVAAPPSMAVYRGKAFRVSTRFFEKTSSNTEVPDTAAEMGAWALWNRVPCGKAIGALAGAGGPVRWRALLRLPPTSTRRVAPGPALRCLPSPRPPTQLVVRDAAREAAASAEFPARRVLQGGQRHVSQAAERVGVELLTYQVSDQPFPA